jgi:Mn2+/Fe2+ NRAMP family transporter
MSNAQIQALALKLVQVIMLLTGVAFTAYNLFSFKVVKNGYYYIDDNQTWLAVGVTAITISYVIKNWNKL